jgi:hypothetical protein
MTYPLFGFVSGSGMDPDLESGSGSWQAKIVPKIGGKEDVSCVKSWRFFLMSFAGGFKETYMLLL